MGRDKKDKISLQRPQVFLYPFFMGSLFPKIAFSFFFPYTKILFYFPRIEKIWINMSFMEKSPSGER